MVSVLIIGLANHREEDAEGDNASPMTSPSRSRRRRPRTRLDAGDAADRRVALVHCCPRRERAERGRDADAQRQAFRINAGHGEVDDDVPRTVPLWMRVRRDGETAADEGRVVVGDARECAVEEEEGDVRRVVEVMP